MLNQKIGLAVLLGAIAAGDAMAQSTLTNYNTGDVLLCFRGPGAYDMVVDAGAIGNYTSLAANSRTVLTQYTGSQLAQIGTNGVSWSAFTYTSDNSLYMTRARAASLLNSQSPPWIDASATAQSGTAVRIAKIPPGAAGNYGNGLDNGASTPGAIIEENNSVGNNNYPTGLSYHDALFGNAGYATWNQTFQGNPENTTGSHFNTSGSVARSDFYRLNPASAGSYAVQLGYFELNTNGVMTYVAYPSTPAVINSVSRNGNVTTINYNSGANGIYSLVESDDLTVPISLWTVVPTTLSNNANGAICTDTTTDAVRFYTIIAN